MHEEGLPRRDNDLVTDLGHETTQPDNIKSKKSKTSSKKVKWTEQEDQMLIQSIEQVGTSNWSLVASYLPGRSGKQCRERWTNQLDPMLNRDNWTPHEDALLLYNQQIYGNCWSKIMQFLPGRSSNSVKNRWCWLTRHRSHPPKAAQLLSYIAQKRASAPTVVPILPNRPVAPQIGEGPTTGSEQVKLTNDTVFTPQIFEWEMFSEKPFDADACEPLRFSFDE